jgi:hypothetical protein
LLYCSFPTALRLSSSFALSNVWDEVDACSFALLVPTVVPQMLHLSCSSGTCNAIIR